jgi:hypothetical protein
VRNSKFTHRRAGHEQPSRASLSILAAYALRWPVQALTNARPSSEMLTFVLLGHRRQAENEDIRVEPNSLTIFAHPHAFHIHRIYQLIGTRASPLIRTGRC